MSVWRQRPRPTGPATGRLVVAASVLQATTDALRCSRWRRREERLVLWAGRQIANDSLVLTCVRPETDSGPGRVIIDAGAVGDASIAARALRLGVIAQVHTHPGSDTRHSDGDDDLILMPFEGMFSLVVGHYGRAELRHGQGLGIHQYQSGEWVAVPPEHSTLVVVPDFVDARA